MSSFYTTKEWIKGDNTQKKCAKLYAEIGFIVIPVYDFNDRDKATKAPILFCNKKINKNKIIVGPDLLLLSLSANFWQDIKAKSQPTWRRLKPNNLFCNPSTEGHLINPFPRWEHGFDYSLLKEYKQVQDETNILTLIIVHEEKSPLDNFNESLLEGEEKFLSITLDDILYYGDHRKDWPGGKKEPNRRGRRGEGGILWARNIMSEIDFSNDNKAQIIKKFKKIKSKNDYYEKKLKEINKNIPKGKTLQLF